MHLGALVKRKTFTAGEVVEVLRNTVTKTWELAKYGKPLWRGWHKVELKAPRRIDSMTGADCSDDNPRLVWVYSCCVPTQRLRERV